MIPPKDRVGNVLAQGDLVAIGLASDLYVGSITEVKAGGLSLAILDKNQQPQQTPNILMITIQIPIVFQDGVQIGALAKMVDPRAQAMIQEAVEKMKKDKDFPFLKSSDDIK